MTATSVATATARFACVGSTHEQLAATGHVMGLRARCTGDLGSSGSSTARTVRVGGSAGAAGQLRRSCRQTGTEEWSMEETQTCLFGNTLPGSNYCGDTANCVYVETCAFGGGGSICSQNSCFTTERLDEQCTEDVESNGCFSFLEGASMSNFNTRMDCSEPVSEEDNETERARTELSGFYVVFWAYSTISGSCQYERSPLELSCGENGFFGTPIPTGQDMICEAGEMHPNGAPSTIICSRTKDALSYEVEQVQFPLMWVTVYKRVKWLACTSKMICSKQHPPPPLVSHLDQPCGAIRRATK